MGATPVLALPWPDPGPANGPQALEDLAVAMEGVLADANVQTYTPDWTATGSVQPSGASVRTGRYSIDRGVCTLGIYVAFGASVIGGRGELRLSLPTPARTDLNGHVLTCRTLIPTIGRWAGMGIITSNVPGWVRPVFPSIADSLLTWWRSSDNAGTAGTGYPPAAGMASVRPSGYITVTGTYFVA